MHTDTVRPEKSKTVRGAPAGALRTRRTVATDLVTQYARDVVARRIVAGKAVRFACERHLRDVKLARARGGHPRGLRWEPARAEHAFGFFRALRLADGEHAGAAFELQPWQKFIVGSLFGWLIAAGGESGQAPERAVGTPEPARPEAPRTAAARRRGVDTRASTTWVRRFRTAYIEIGKGNGKTPLAAGLGLYMMIGAGEHGAECYSAAVGRDQAGICFRDALRFRNGSPALVNSTVEHAANLAFPALGSFFRPISSEGRGLDGKRVYYAAVDELHEHASSVVLDKMRAGTKLWDEALIFMITNSGYDRHSVCWQQHEFSLKVLEGLVENDEHFAYVCALDEGDDWMRDEKCWPKANPNLGVSISHRYLRGLVAEAREMPSKQNLVARLNFCVWTEQATRWLPLDRWDGCAGEVDLEQLRGRECFGGLDLASVSDICALAWVFPPAAAGEPWKVLTRFWVPEENVARRARRDRVPYDRWIADGLIEATPGNVCDYDIIRARILEDCERFRVREIAIDRWNATQISTQLQEEGLTVALFGQGFASMAAPCRELERLVMGGELAHGGNAVLRWMAANCAAAQDPAGNLKPDKAKSTEKIDGIVALLMGLGRAIVLQEDAGTPGVVVIG